MALDILKTLDAPIPLKDMEKATDVSEMLEKCGEVFLQRHLGSLLYVCSLCNEQFETADGFSTHVADIHLSLESLITYEPSESGDSCVKTDPIGKNVQEQFDMLVTEDMIKDEELFNNVDSSESAARKEIERNFKEKVKQKIELEDEFEATPFEITFYDDKHEKQINKGDEADPSDEEILRSKLTCKFCGDLFDYVRELRQHDCGLNKKKKLHNCSVCGKQFKKKSGLDIHFLLHKGEKPHKCEICGSAYACKQNLIVHIRRHTGEKPFKCDYCDRRFASSTEKISHTRTHTGDRPYVCELCGKGHSSTSQLTEHMRRHLDIRNYPCEICDKRFRNSYNLRMHRHTHDRGPRQYECEICKSTFRTQNNLLQHAKIHEQVKKYVCKICGRAFAQHPGLYSHMKSHGFTKI